LLGAPEVHASSVHALPSTGTSVSSTTAVTAPEPSHTFLRQSPGVWAVVVEPDGLCDHPHVPETHARLLQSVSAPGQSAASAHGSGQADVARAAAGTPRTVSNP
jgi:hypothetical protein